MLLSIRPFLTFSLTTCFYSVFSWIRRFTSKRIRAFLMSFLSIDQPPIWTVIFLLKNSYHRCLCEISTDYRWQNSEVDLSPLHMCKESSNAIFSNQKASALGGKIEYHLPFSSNPSSLFCYGFCVSAWENLKIPSRRLPIISRAFHITKRIHH